MCNDSGLPQAQRTSVLNGMRWKRWPRANHEVKPSSFKYVTYARMAQVCLSYCRSLLLSTPPFGQGTCPHFFSGVVSWMLLGSWGWRCGQRGETMEKLRPPILAGILPSMSCCKTNDPGLQPTAQHASLMVLHPHVGEHVLHQHAVARKPGPRPFTFPPISELIQHSEYLLRHSWRRAWKLVQPSCAQCR